MARSGVRQDLRKVVKQYALSDVRQKWKKQDSDLMLVRRKMYYGQVHLGYNKIVLMKGGFQGVVAQPGRPLCAH